jgi:hypothetical protein
MSLRASGSAGTASAGVHLSFMAGTPGAPAIPGRPGIGGWGTGGVSNG